MRIIQTCQKMLRASYCGDGSSRGLLSSIENIDPHLLQSRRRKGGEVQCYAWYVPDGSLPERKVMTEERREELLTLLYQDKLNADQIQELVKEWIDLLRERDSLLKQEIQQENREVKEEYLRDLEDFLNYIPLAEQSYEEQQLKDCLTVLKRQVTNYCSSHNIDLTTRPYVGTFNPVRSRLSQQGSHPSPVHVSDGVNEIDGGGGTAQVLKQSSPQMPSGGEAGNVVEVEAVIECAPQEKLSLPPPPTFCPPPPPPPPPPPLPLSTSLPPIFSGATKTSGTVQFVGRTTPDSNNPPTPKLKHSQYRMERSFVDEIASVGQTKLRRTKQPRSPGGTPLKTPAKARMATPLANEKIQQALLNRLKNLQSTPLHHKSSISDPNDLSNQWSDVNSFDDPDLTTGDTTSGLLHHVSSPDTSQGFNPSSSKVSTPKPRKGASSGKWNFRKKLGLGVSPNTSTAV